VETLFTSCLLDRFGKKNVGIPETGEGAGCHSLSKSNSEDFPDVMSRRAVSAAVFSLPGRAKSSSHQPAEDQRFSLSNYSGR